MVEIREIVDQPLLDQLFDERLAQTLDVHRAARGEVLEASPQARRARGVLAAPDHLVGVAMQVASARRACGRHDPGLGTGRSQAQHG
jgi:hypothetical protein